MNQTLEDIIKTRRLVSKAGGGAKGKFNTFRSSGGGPGGLSLSTKKGGRFAQAGPKIAPTASRLGDARMKIIAKKRQNLVDARDQLNEIARQGDAREKLVMLRAKKGGGAKPKSLFTKALGGLKTGGVTKQRTQSAYVNKRQKFNLSRNANSYVASNVPLQALTRTVLINPDPVPRSYLQMGRLGRAEPLHDIDVEVYNDLDAVDRMSPPRSRERLPNYDELLAMYARNKLQRAPVQPSASKRPPVSRPALRKPVASSMRMDQYFKEDSDEEDEDDDGMDVDDLPPQTTKFLGRTIQTKQAPATNMFRRAQNAPTLRVTAKKPAPEGYRVRVSNLAPSVTKDDIMELFSDPGPLNHWDLLPGGIAEVYYKKRGDAINAVDAYHKRLLDGQPMAVTFYDR